METITEPQREIPVISKADVVVVGGGTSGFIAATAAARAGAKTVLIERLNYLGGCTTTTYNTSLGVWMDSNGDQIIRGLPFEFLKRLEAEGDCFIDEKLRPQLWPPTTKKVALDMIQEAGVELWFYTWVAGVIKEDGRIKGVIAENKGGRGAILGTAFVDASGDADIAAFAGAPFFMTPVEEQQQVSIDYTACGVDSAKVIEWARNNLDKIRGVSGLSVEHKKYGAQPMFTFVIPNPDPSNRYHIGVMPTVKLCVYNEAVRLQGNVEIDPTDPKCLTYAEVKGLYGAREHLDYLRSQVPGFEGAFIVAQNHLGVRESRQITGDYMITIDDLNNQARFDDVVALNCRGLDYHLKGTVFKISHYEGHHDIPLRSLLPQGVTNLAVAGRCISCDHLSQASIRGAATCLATGQAAGVAAAVAADKKAGDIRATSIFDIQGTLIGQDAILGTRDRAQAFAR